jgi:Rap1a immunity proteins
MWAIIVAGAVALSVLASDAAQARGAHPMTVYELLQVCAFDKSGCRWFIVGVVDAMQVAQSEGGSIMGWRACFDDDIVQTGRTLSAAERSLLKHSTQPDLSATALVAQAVAEAFPFPCP